MTDIQEVGELILVVFIFFLPINHYFWAIEPINKNKTWPLLTLLIYPLIGVLLILFG